MTDKERLEEIKEHFRWTIDNSLVPRLSDSDTEWLIKQAERLEAIIKHRNDILKANEYLNEQNQRYKQALEEVKKLTRYDDGTEEEVYIIVTEALEPDND